ncbi:MAG TPA: T9SS type A sorting domain-containing protein, partial [Bacteroidia bacterium]|nr:T9SS type A sorting domain-containing protein [Bacteroidia bacterium]
YGYEVCWRQDNLNLTIGIPPTANAGNDQTISQSNTILTANDPSPGNGLWTVISGTATFNDATLYNTSVSNLSNGTNLLRWTITMGTCSSYDEMTVTVATTPVSAIISGDTTICNGGQTQLKIDFTGNGPFDYSYTNGTTVFGPFTAVTNPEIIWVNPASTTNYQLVSVSSGGTSGTVSGSANIQILTALPSSNVTLPFNGMPTHICNGTTANLSIASVAGATNYIWDAPAGSYFNGNPLNTSPYTSTLPSVQITFGAPSGSFYTIGVQAANPCGTTLRKIEKVRGIISTPSVINGLTIACANTNGNYSINAVTGATSYQWSITGDATVSGNGTSVSISFGPTWSGGTLCVAAQAGCYTTVSKCMNIENTLTTVYAPTGTFTACPNSVLTYSVPSQPGVASYNWALPIGASGYSTTNSITVTFGPNFVNSGNICVSSTTICGTTTPPKCKTIKIGLPGRPSSITGATTGLCNVSESYSCPIISGATYNWTAPSGAVITGNGNNAITVDYGTFSSGSLCVSATNSCGTGSPRCIAVKGAPSKPGAISSLPSTWCTPATNVQFNSNISNLAGNYSLKWQIAPSANATIIGPNNTNQMSADWLASGTASVQLMAYNTCGSATTTLALNIPACKLSASNFNNRQEGVLIYPNPASDFVTIQLPEDLGSDITVELYTSEGSLVSRRIINSTQLFSLPPSAGLYFIRVISPQQSQTIKLVVE